MLRTDAEILVLLQRSGVLEQVWNQEDVWPVISCKAFILEWAFMLERKVED